MMKSNRENKGPEILRDLWDVIGDRAEHPIPGSYTSRLMADPKGIDKVLEKVGEESTEFILAVKNGVNDRTIEETADLFFHIMVALKASDIDIEDVFKELEKRRK